MTDSAAQRERARLLVVDDDEGLGRLISKNLEREGHDVARAATGDEALRALEERPADLLLLDLKLGDIDARELVRATHARGVSIPYIIITGQGDERVAVEMMREGALDYLVKDADFLTFLPTVVRRSLDRLAQDRRLAHAEAALHKEFAFTSAVLDTCGALIVVLDPAGRIIRFNRAAEKVTGRRLGDVRGRSFFELFLPPEELPTVRNVFARLVAGEPFIEHAHAIRAASGEHRLITWSSTGLSFAGANGAVDHVVTTGIDVTESRQLENEVLQVSERERRRIGQDLHDGLGQHLTGIEFMSEVLAQRLAVGRTRELRDAAARAAEINRHVREAIAQARSLARGLAPIVLESEGLIAALSQLAANTEQMFQVKCTFQADPAANIADHRIAIHLYRIAQEAISNAIRHGKSKRIVVCLQGSPERTVLLIKDHGRGLPPDVATTSAGPADRRGLGLRIMKYRAGIIGGSLLIPRPLPPMTASRKKPASPPRTRILIVDDHPIMRQGLTALINNERDLLICAEAENAAQAMELVQSQSPDLVLLDLTLPDKNGLELIKDLLAPYPKLPIVVISMHDESIYAERVLKAGGRGYVMKQEGGKRLVEAIRRVLDGHIAVSEKMAGRILELFSGRRSATATSPIQSLTDREFEIFQLIGEGRKTSDIARHLHLSVKTVEVHRLHIKAKLSLPDATSLIREAVRWVEGHATGGGV